jgi:beta-glucosidase
VELLGRRRPPQARPEVELNGARRLEFPPGFVWGTATAAYQIEGAWDADGRGPSIWDDYCHAPGNVLGGDTGDVACDHYARVDADLDLMAKLGLPAYRFSVAWPRVMPTGSGSVNPLGLDFYDRLVDGLLERGIEPLVTLYHWDLPSQLQRAYGGWTGRRTAELFADYALVVGERLGDRVPWFGTLNEPYCSAFLGHATGSHAPGWTDASAAYSAAHHLNLAHGLATSALRSVAPHAKVSVSLNLAQVYPATDREEDREAAAHVDMIANRIFLEPMLRGRYPDGLIEATAGLADWSVVRDDDLQLIHQPLDALGVNFYSPSRIGGAAHRPATGSTSTSGRWVHDPARGDAAATPWPGTDRAWSVPQPGPYTEMGWRIEPRAFTDLLVRVGRDYPEVPILVTENGAAMADEVDASGQVLDDHRIDYLRAHLAAVHAAIAAGADVRGYYLWSFLDNFEWSLGYVKRFGLVRVDYDTLVRTPKASAAWYGDVIAANAVEVAEGR